MGLDAMKPLFVYVKGGHSDAPSSCTGFRAISHDCVRWWDRRSNPRPSDFVKLRRFLIRAMRGESTRGDPVRPIRLSNKLSTAHAFDDLRMILESSGPPSCRMKRVDCLLKGYCKSGLIARPVIDIPSEVHMCGCPRDCPASISLPKCRKDAIVAMSTAVQQCSECSGADVLVFYDRTQYGYISTVLGPSMMDSLRQNAACLCIREFVVKEKLGHGLDIDTMERCTLGGAEACPNKGVIMASICDRLGVMELLRGVSLACKVSIQEAIDHGVRFRCTRLISLHSRHASVRSPIRPADPNTVQKVIGGHVIDPTRSIVNSPVAVLDFASLYPSIIAATGVRSDMELPAIVRYLMQCRRDSTDAGVARACKLVANSIYGQLASPTSPLYDPVSANAITAKGRQSINALADYLRCNRGEVVYGDTDSCMVTFDGVDEPDACMQKAKRCAVEFNASLRDPMRTALQAVFKRMVFLSKKKYIGMDAGGSLHYCGTINVRNDCPRVVCEEYEGLSSMLMRDSCTIEDVNGAIAKARDNIQNACAARMSCIRRLSSLHSADVSAPPHIEFARCESFREAGSNYGEGDSIEFVPFLDAASGSNSWSCARVCDAVEDHPVAWLPAWKTFITASADLVKGVLGCTLDALEA